MRSNEDLDGHLELLFAIGLCISKEAIGQVDRGDEWKCTLDNC